MSLNSPAGDPSVLPVLKRVSQPIFRELSESSEMNKHGHLRAYIPAGSSSNVCAPNSSWDRKRSGISIAKIGSDDDPSLLSSIFP